MKKELSTTDETLSGELSEKHEHFRKELSLTMPEEESSPNDQKKRFIEVLTQRQARRKEEEVFDSVNKKLSESKCGFREMLL